MIKKAGKVGASVAALAAIAVGSAAIADAATSGNKGSTSTPTPQAQPPGAYGQAYPGGPPPGARPDGRGPRGHRPETALTGDTAQKVKDAALAKVKGGTIERVETDTDQGSPYEAHVRKSDGSEVVVLVNKQFEVTAVEAFGGPRGGGFHGGPPPAGSRPGGYQGGSPGPAAPQA